MPPWGAVKGFGDLSPDNALSQQEMLMIAGWVIGGVPEGDPALGPKLLVAPAKPPSTPMRDAIEIDGEKTLPHAVVAAGLRALAPVESAKITAVLPDGAVIPLVWLYKYDPAMKLTYRFAKPIPLPAGTKVCASSSNGAAVRFALTAPSPAR